MKIERNYILLTIIWTILIWLTVQQYGDVGILDGFVGPDSYLRMVRVGELHTNFDWYDSIIERLAPPHGMDIHWTRPHDVLILSLAALAAPFAGWETGLYLAGMMISPLLLLATAIALYWTTSGLFRPQYWLFSSAALFLLPTVRSYGVIGRPDHHLLLLFATVIMVGLALRSYTSTEPGRRALWLGASLGFGLWLSVELLFMFIGVAGFLALLWVWSPEERIRQNIDLSLAMLGMVFLAVIIESPPGHWLSPAFDKISIVHVGVTALFAGYWMFVSAIQRAGKLPQTVAGRLAIGGVAIFVFSLVMELVFPGFFRGPMGQVHPDTLALFENVTEMRSMFHYSPETLLSFLGDFMMPLIAIVYGVFQIRQPRDAMRQKGFLGIFILLVFTTILSAIHLRFSIYMQGMALILITHLLDRIFRSYQDWHFGRLNGLAAGITAILLLFGGTLAGSFLRPYVAPNPVQLAGAVCVASLVASELDEWSSEPRTILALVDHGPELLYRTAHSFVAAPYHRSGQAIVDHREIMRARDDRLALDLLLQYQVDAILICPQEIEIEYFGGNQPGTLYYRIVSGDRPDWLGSNVLADKGGHDFELYPLERDLMAE